jgi:hypothetical protein
MDPETFANASDLFLKYVIQEEMKPCYRRGCVNLEKAVNKLHAMLKGDPRHAWAYVGGRYGRALLRGGLLNVMVPENQENPELWVRDWFRAYDDVGYLKYYS